MRRLISKKKRSTTSTNAPISPTWQSYLDKNLMASGYIHKATIVGITGGYTCWATSHDGFTPSNLQSLCDAMDQAPPSTPTTPSLYPSQDVFAGAQPPRDASQDSDSFMNIRIELDGQTFVPLYVSRSSLYAKSVPSLTTLDASYGCVVVKCSTCVIIATYHSTTNPGSANMVVERLGSFLKDKGY